MSRVQGRTAHVIRRLDGSPLTTPLVTSFFGRVDAHDWVRRYQVREEGGRRLRFLISVRQAPSDAQRERLFRSIETGVGAGFTVGYEFVDQIPAAPSGKLQYLVPLSRQWEAPTERPAA